MGQCYHGLIHTESSYLLPAIPHPAHPHGWCSNGHGRHTRSHCTRLLPAAVYYYCWCGKCRLHRHADFGWRWWSPSLTKGRAGPPGHCAVCALQRLQNGQFFLHLSFYTCWLSASSSTPLLLTAVLVMKIDIRSYSYNAPLFFESRQAGFVGFASSTDGHHRLKEVQKFPHSRLLNVAATCNRWHFSCTVKLCCRHDT